MKELSKQKVLFWFILFYFCRYTLHWHWDFGITQYNLVKHYFPKKCSLKWLVEEGVIVKTFYCLQAVTSARSGTGWNMHPALPWSMDENMSPLCQLSSLAKTPLAKSNIPYDSSLLFLILFPLLPQLSPSYRGLGVACRSKTLQKGGKTRAEGLQGVGMVKKKRGEKKKRNVHCTFQMDGKWFAGICWQLYGAV